MASRIEYRITAIYGKDIESGERHVVLRFAPGYTLDVVNKRFDAIVEKAQQEMKYPERVINRVPAQDRVSSNFDISDYFEYSFKIESRTVTEWE